MSKISSAYYKKNLYLNEEAKDAVDKLEDSLPHGVSLSQWFVGKVMEANEIRIRTNGYAKTIDAYATEEPVIQKTEYKKTSEQEELSRNYMAAAKAKRLAKKEDV